MMSILSPSLRETWSRYRRHEIPHLAGRGPDRGDSAKRFLITAGFGPSYAEAANRLAEQARSAGWFDDVIVVTENSKALGVPDILREIEELRRKFPKGYGLWAWKPAIVKAALSGLPAGALLFYVDAGCEMSAFGTERFDELSNWATRHSALFFSLPFLEREGTRADLFDRYGPLQETPQIQATWFALRNDEIGRSIANNWHDASRADDFSFLKEMSDSANSAALQHRHDQSVLSCIVKSQFPAVVTLPWEDYFAPWLYHVNSPVLLQPIHALRQRGARSILNPLLRRSTLEQCTLERRGASVAGWFRRSGLRLRHLLEDELRIAVDRRRHIKRLRREAATAIEAGLLKDS